MRAPARTGTAAVVALLAGVVLAACEGHPTAARERLLVGTWEWVGATGGVAGVEITPETEGYTQEVEFLDGTTVELRRDGVTRVRAGFVLLPPAADGNAPPYPIVRYDEPLMGGFEEQLLVEIGDATLVLADPCCDGFVHEFRREG